MLVDSHCHLDFPDFEDDMDDIVARAGEAGVSHMLSICTHVTKFDPVLAVAEQYDNIFCTVGIHPHNAAKEPEVTAEHLIRMARNDKVIGFGETGLDFFYDKSPRDLQKSQFKVHIEAAREAGLPLVVHTRDADEDMAEILKEETGKGAFSGLLHCFSSSRDLAETALDLGLYLSISGIVTFNKADELRKIVKEAPLDRLLVETDAPYLAPVPKRGKRNEPAFTRHTAEKIAEIKEISFEEVATATTDNFFNLFSKA
ncbi:MAG TPA: TatD family hydrolase [Rhodospirillales bacterium]|nr:TatD family hydrolase [Rhodospirillales bacterium]|tara:strand:- start:46 stop:816 length:771 start_codon:yes stop_codon:yes gene_type:complete